MTATIDTDKVPDEYTAPSNCQIEIGQDERGYWVRCWNEDQELHWEVRGVTIADDGHRQTREPFTRETALAEFNRWRR